MDPLDRLAEAATGLLARVDETLTSRGAPAGHPVWPLLRRLRTLPGDAVAALAQVRPGALPAAGFILDQLRLGYEDAGAALTECLPTDRVPDHPHGEFSRWAGVAADAFDAHRRMLADHLSGGPVSLTARVTATTGYAAALVDWIGETRVGLAGALAEVLGSAQAVTLMTAGRDPLSAGSGADPPSDGAVAAADIANHLLAALDRACGSGERLCREWEDRLMELPLRPASTADVPATVDPWRGAIHFGE